MTNKNIAEQINKTIEDIWFLLEAEERKMTKFVLNNQQHVLLTLIIRYPCSVPTELAERMNVTKSAVSQQLTKLEKEGYIIKKQDEKDKRVFFIELGEKGLIYKRELDLFNKKMLNIYLSKLSSEELLNMQNAFQKMQKILEEEM